MKVIVRHPRSAVFFDENRDVFIKNFNPKLINRIKFFLGLRRYPGENFYYISKLLNTLNINTPPIINYSKYSVETQNVPGLSLEKALEKNSDNHIIIEQYISFILRLLENNIYCGDLKFDNFIVYKNKLYALDLEDYRHVKFFKHTNEEFLKRLKGKIPKELFEIIINRLQTT